jgi:copper chaperone CopZ
VNELRLVVEHAGCDSCAERVRSALAGLLAIETIAVDEATDTATVIGHAEQAPALDAIDAALAEASHGSGHTYRVRRS